MNMIEGPGFTRPNDKCGSKIVGRDNDLQVSFEFFPPRTSEAVAPFWAAIDDLSSLGPRFISVTYGAGGTTRDQTRDLVSEIQARCHVPAAAHLTCAGASRAEIDSIAESYWQAGIHRLVALRGDPPKAFATDGSAARYVPHADGYAYADQLVAGLARLHPFDISVAAYPETHPEALSAEADLNHLKRKIDAGATRAITQFFFDVDCYKRFLDRAQRAGIQVPIVPGILPIRHVEKTLAMAKACGTSVPDAIHESFARAGDDPGARHRAAIEIAIAQCQQLKRAGVRHFHFYALNQADLVRPVCAEIGIVSPLFVAR